MNSIVIQFSAHTNNKIDVFVKGKVYLSLTLHFDSFIMILRETKWLIFIINIFLRGPKSIYSASVLQFIGFEHVIMK